MIECLLQIAFNLSATQVVCLMAGGADALQISQTLDVSLFVVLPHLVPLSGPILTLSATPLTAPEGLLTYASAKAPPHLGFQMVRRLENHAVLGINRGSSTGRPGASPASFRASGRTLSLASLARRDNAGRSASGTFHSGRSPSH